MRWSIVFTEQAKKQFEKLPPQARQRIVTFLNSRVVGSAEPRMLAKQLVGSSRGLWRFCVGDYRIIVRFDDDKLVVLVVTLGQSTRYLSLTSQRWRMHSPQILTGRAGFVRSMLCHRS
jgi:mRNA interferase RelE/StbE